MALQIFFFVQLTELRKYILLLISGINGDKNFFQSQWIYGQKQRIWHYNKLKKNAIDL